MSNLMQRILVAVVGIPIVVYIVLFRPVALLVLLLILALITVHEYYGLAKVKGFLPQVVAGLTLTFFIVLTFAEFRLGLLFPHAGLFHSVSFNLLSIVLIFGVLSIFIAEMIRSLPNPFVHIAITISGAIYIGLGLGALFGVHEYFVIRTALASSEGAISAGPFVVTILASIWICDTAAFALGRWTGKHIIAPKISPGKTWEGAVWGLVFAILTWIAARTLIPQLAGLSITTCIVMGFIVGVIGQTGDFAESQLKRDAGVKDSSALIPGHGGMLDRLDSILFVAPATYLYLYLAGV